MKKKILCTMMSMVMAASLFAGCGTGTGTETSASDNSKTEETGTEAAEQPTSDNPYAAYAGTTISVAAIETGYGSQMSFLKPASFCRVITISMAYITKNIPNNMS